MNGNPKTGGRDGFTLVELMIALLISVFLIAAVSTLYAQLYRQYKQQSRAAGTDIGSALGLNYLKNDIQAAGYGLPWSTISPVSYNEYIGNSPVARNADDSPGNPPRAIVPVAGGANGTNAFGDYLVIKSQSAAVNDTAAGKSTTLPTSGVPNPWTTGWAQANCANDPENLCPSDRVVVLSNLDKSPTLVYANNSYSPMYDDPPGNLALYASITNTTNMVYGVASAADAPNGLEMPFHRTDYFIAAGAQNDWDNQNVLVPKRCAPGTGELVKAVVNQSDGKFTYYPILDCAATMKVNFMRANGALADANAVSADNTAALVRQDVRQVRVFILAQEGQMDPSYTSGPIWLGDCASPPVASGICTSYPLAADQLHYRWKAYTVIEKPFNLGAQ
ncbi:MAG: prepilin-type N-terminal cleavage/methylation domain-containing protein [Nitrospiraceae bacterium]|nr:prepilin-type N-terminal cleavage/methylation domain-containing protein [Nitrospiraceae bacterium]